MTVGFRASVGFRGIPPSRLVRRVARFTGDGTWTVPAGVTYAVAHVLGGGGGTGRATGGSGGSASSVTFPSATITSNGGVRALASNIVVNQSYPGRPNSGRGSVYYFVSSGSGDSNDRFSSNSPATHAQWVVGGSSVTPGGTVAVVVGAGGTAGTGGGAGGSGYVWIEYEQEVPAPKFPSRLVRRVARFTGNGTWTVPAGVTYAVAHVLGGGGGCGRGTTGGFGANSSVALPGLTVVSDGAPRALAHNVGMGQSSAGQANSGRGARFFHIGSGGTDGNDRWAGNTTASDSQWIVAGRPVTPGDTVAVVVGGGGAAGTAGAVGGSGYVFIEYEQEV